MGFGIGEPKDKIKDSTKKAEGKKSKSKIIPKFTRFADFRLQPVVKIKYKTHSMLRKCQRARRAQG